MRETGACTTARRNGPGWELQMAQWERRWRRSARKSAGHGGHPPVLMESSMGRGTGSCYSLMPSADSPSTYCATVRVRILAQLYCSPPTLWVRSWGNLLTQAYPAAILVNLSPTLYKYRLTPVHTNGILACKHSNDMWDGRDRIPNPTILYFTQRNTS